MFKLQTDNSSAKPTRFARAFNFFGRIHQDERGTISIVTVFTLLGFTMLLVMIGNLATHLDDKLNMQNAADAAAYSGGVVLARGMNTVAFSNHLLFDVFALTAFLREGQARSAEQLTGEILDEWDQVGQIFSQAEFEKFENLGNAIRSKVPVERELINTFGESTQVASELTLPVFESILLEEMIPEFQRTVIETIAPLAQRTANEVAYRHGLTRRELHQVGSSRPTESRNRQQQAGVLWRMTVQPVGSPNEFDPLSRTLPVVDPAPAGNDAGMLTNADEYFTRAVEQRRQMSKFYLEEWIADKLRVFDTDAEMSQMSNLWRIFAGDQLVKLLAEYPDRNLPLLIRDNEITTEELDTVEPGPSRNVHLEQNYHFLGVVYRRHLSDFGPGIFQNPMKSESDAQAFAQVSVFVPRARSVLVRLSRPNQGSGEQEDEEVWASEGWPRHWDALNQNWTTKIVPATASALPTILSQPPQELQQVIRTPQLNNVSIEDLRRVNNH